MEELTRFVGSLGLPGWVTIILVLLIVMHKLGILQGVGQSLQEVISGKQTLMVKLVDKALDQNGVLINFITDRLENDVQDVKEELGKLSNRIASVETYNRMITHLLTENERTEQRQRDDKVFELVSDLQERMAGIEARTRQDEAVDQLNPEATRDI